MTHNSSFRLLRFSGVALLLLAGCSGGGMTSEDEELLGSKSEALRVSSALDCPNGVGSACTVPNMPLLHQNSDQVDVDIGQNIKDNGCYDTSVASITSMALTNRGGLQPLANRSSTFHTITAGNNGKNPPAATTREYEQLSQQYRWTQKHYADRANNVNPAVQPFYFAEVLSDFPAQKKRTYPANCDPRTYGSCTWSTLIAAGFAGASFRDFFDGTAAQVGNDYVKALMGEGFGVLAAYGRYNAVPCADDASFTCFNRASQHKVVFSGTFADTDTYPLRINDVGDGKQYKVRLSSDQGVFGRNNAKCRFPSETSRTFLEYQPNPNQNPQVFFLDHIDGFSLNLNSGQGIATTMDRTWGTGFTSMMPFTMNGKAHLLAYNTNTGTVHFDRFLPEASGVEVAYNSTWGTGFTHFVPYYINGSPYFLAYNSSTGALHYDTFRQDLQGPIVNAMTTVSTGFTSIVPFTKGGQNYVLFYNKATGAVAYDQMNATGSGATTVYSSNWGTGWTDFTFYYIGGEPHFIAYNASTGLTHYDRIASNVQSGVDVLTQFTDAKNRKFANIAFQGPGHVLTYDSSGNGWAVRMRLDGKDSAATWSNSLLPSATSSISFLQDGKSYQLMYDAVSGKVRSYRLNLF